jgi:hypothetical protein
MTPDDLDDHFGLCPKCHETDGFVNAGKSHFFICKVHKLYWFVGANFFSSWKEQTEEEQRKIWEDTGMEHFEEVKPFLYPRPPEPRPDLTREQRRKQNPKYIDDMDVFDAMRWLLDNNVDLDNRDAVVKCLRGDERTYVYDEDTATSDRFINWCIRAAKANLAVGGLERQEDGCSGFVPPEHGDVERFSLGDLFEEKCPF